MHWMSFLAAITTAFVVVPQAVNAADNAPALKFTAQVQETTNQTISKSLPIKGILVDADGKPVPEAKVVLLPSGHTLFFQNGQLESWDQMKAAQKTASDGTFSFPPQQYDYLLVAMNEHGYAMLNGTTIEKTEELVLKPWGRIEGEFYNGTAPIPDAEIQLSPVNIGSGKNEPQLFMTDTATTDTQGKFIFNHAFPGTFIIVHQRALPGNVSIWTNRSIVSLGQGETIHLRLGGKGRPVIGHIALPVGMTPETCSYSGGTLTDDRSHTSSPATALPIPDDILKMPPIDRVKWQTDFCNSDAGRKWTQSWLGNPEKMAMPPLPVHIEPDGSFLIPDVPEGFHFLSCSVGDTSEKKRYPFARLAGFAGKMFTMPPVPGGVSDEPLDLGTLEVQPAVMKAGDNAPDFTVKTYDSKNWRLTDQKGKVTLIYSWDVFLPFSPTPDAQLQDLWKTYGSSGKFTMIGISGGTDPLDIERRLLKVQAPSWPMALIDDAPDPLFQLQYRPAVPCLIGPDGKVIAIHLSAKTLQKSIDDAVKSIP